MSVKNDSSTKYPGDLAKIKKELKGLERFTKKLYHLAGLEGKVLQIPKAKMLDLAGEVDMLIDAVHYQLNPRFAGDRAGGHAG